MRKRTKIISAIVVSAFCVLISAGVAYGAILSAEDSEDEMIIDSNAVPMDVEEGAGESNTGPLKAPNVGSSEDEVADASAIEQSPGGSSTISDPNAVATVPEMLPENTVEMNADVNEISSQTPRTLTILGQTIPYVDSYNSTSAPVETAGIWAGSESTTDGSWGYFVGHHPGVFNCVMNLQDGDAVQVCDNCGNTRTYHVISIYDIPNYTSYEELAADVESHGESVTLQTCYGDNQHYRIVEAI